MHQYLKAIGFEEIQTKSGIKSLLDKTKDENDFCVAVPYKEDSIFFEFIKECGKDIGLLVGGEVENATPDMEFNPEKITNFESEYYFPIFQGRGITTSSKVSVERRIDRELYVGCCEDSRVGISLIFHLINGIEYMNATSIGIELKPDTPVTLSGLALSGTILLPVCKSEQQVRNEQKSSENRKELLDAARNGDSFAIEKLTIDDINTYSKVSKRLNDEDVFTIVNTYFMPYGLECDRYSIMGEILEIREIENTFTHVELYILTLDVNEMRFDVCVPKKSVLGEPKIGRRFKGTIWLQGEILF